MSLTRVTEGSDSRRVNSCSSRCYHPHSLLYFIPHLCRRLPPQQEVWKEQMCTHTSPPHSLLPFFVGTRLHYGLSHALSSKPGQVFLMPFWLCSKPADVPAGQWRISVRFSIWPGGALINIFFWILLVLLNTAQLCDNVAQLK